MMDPSLAFQEEAGAPITAVNGGRKEGGIPKGARSQGGLDPHS